jgi:hypothetical protein
MPRLTNPAYLLLRRELGEAWDSDPTPSSYLLMLAVPPIPGFLLSLRIGTSVTADALIVRSYFRNHVFLFTEVCAFQDAPYAGAWTQYQPAASGWFGLGARMLEVELPRAHSRELSATLCGRKTSRALAMHLNDLKRAADERSGRAVLADC